MAFKSATCVYCVLYTGQLSINTLTGSVRKQIFQQKHTVFNAMHRKIVNYHYEYHYLFVLSTTVMDTGITELALSPLGVSRWI